MTKFVIGPDVALMFAEQRSAIPPKHGLLAPTLLRSQVLANLYAQVRGGAIPRKEAERRLDHLRSLRIRLLGDRVLQRCAWDLADRLGWPDTFVAEYVALTMLQGDVLVTRDPGLAQAASAVVPTALPSDVLG